MDGALDNRVQLGQPFQRGPRARMFVDLEFDRVRLALRNTDRHDFLREYPVRLGTLGALGFLHWGRFSLSNEGLSFAFGAGPGVWGPALLASVIVGVCAGLVPALRAARAKPADALRQL